MKKTPIKALLKDTGLTYEEVGRLLNIDPVSIARKMGGGVQKIGDVELVIALWRVLRPKQIPALLDELRTIRGGIAIHSDTDDSP